MSDLKKRAPKGVDPEKHERCVKEVKRKGRSVGSAHAICTAAMKKGESQVESGEKVEAEHKDSIKRIIQDTKAGKLKPLKEYYRGIAKEHLVEIKDYYTRLKRMETKAKKESKFLEKSTYNFKDTLAVVDAEQEHYAAEEACPKLLKYLETSINADLEKIHLEKGILTVYKKDKGLYNGFFSDNDGQVIEEFENVTIPILAKNLELKDLYDRPDRAQDAESTVSGGYIKLKYGDVEIEIKKSMKDFINDFKRTKMINKDKIYKALQAWRRNSKIAKNFKTDLEAARALFKDWEQYEEEFKQTLHAMNQYE
jgi:hypothetical protein